MYGAGEAREARDMMAVAVLALEVGAVGFQQGAVRNGGTDALFAAD